ncbi:MAG TPA: zf-HC2 domain-containing protein [Gemmatimonadaceae bacterium]|jgi:anti-sigma factor RsiW|nr:zf-HC2 domain-containing protein [Gemmatimonadaceae bacterium]
MRECQEEIKDLFPDHVTGRLSPSDAARVTAHVEACPTCAAELAVVRAAHAAFTSFTAPAVDIARIVAALPTPPSKVIELKPLIQRRSRRFTSWRIAATIATIAVSGVSIGVLQGVLRDKPPAVKRVVLKPADAAEASGLTVGGNLNDLSEKEMQTLLDKLDELDAVPSAEPQPAVSGIRAAAGVQ